MLFTSLIRYVLHLFVGFLLFQLEQNLLALKQRFPEHEMILHSDQGSVYSSKKYNELLPMYNVIRSMSRAGTPTDNAAMEAINGWIKAELFTDFHVTGDRDVAAEVDEYIVFFNEQRPAVNAKMDLSHFG